MELILKQPPGKPPFIGILFNKEYEASKLNQAQVQVNNLFYFKVILEPIGTELNLTIKLDEWLFKYTYEGLNYDPDKLKRFLFDTMGAEVYNFGHVVLKNDAHLLVKTLSTQSYFVLRVKELKLLMEE
jgi:hypothetical protein